MRQVTCYMLIVLLLSISASSEAQVVHTFKDGYRAVQLIKELSRDSHPITRDTFYKFPVRLSIKGEVIDYTIGVACGVYCGCGTVKIKLKKRSKDYPYQYVFVALACCPEITDEIKNKKEWRLQKIRIDDNACFWNWGGLNSNGLPYYKVY